MGFFEKVLRRGPKLDKDSHAIHVLRKTGADLTKPIVMRHYLYFAFEYEARAVAAELAAQGFETDLHDAAMNSGLLVLARRAEMIDDETVHALRADLEAQALSQKGEYDGWEVELATGETVHGVEARH